VIRHSLLQKPSHKILIHDKLPQSFRLDDESFGEEMENKLYVGNLPYAATEEQIKAHFSQAGTVTSTALITDRATGRAKGFGFVEMSTAEEAQKAISMFNGQDFMGRAITVNVAKPREDKPRNFGDRNRGGGGGGRNHY
jgi:RNA recognition motif-containing protein